VRASKVKRPPEIPSRALERQSLHAETPTVDDARHARPVRVDDAPSVARASQRRASSHRDAAPRPRVLVERQRRRVHADELHERIAKRREQFRGRRHRRRASGRRPERARVVIFVPGRRGVPRGVVARDVEQRAGVAKRAESIDASTRAALERATIDSASARATKRGIRDAK